nr:hypothetical protein [uncultured Caproiciproducens sp.]
MSLNRNSDNCTNVESTSNDCDCESAKALKKILSLLDDLNNRDLRLLDDVIDRILCTR